MQRTLRLVRPDEAVLAQQVGDFVLSRKAAGRRPATITFYQVTLGQLVKFGPGWPLTTKGLQAFLLHKCETCNEVTLRTYFRSLSAFCNWLEGEARIPDNPMRRMARPRRLRRFPKDAAPSTIRRLFASLEGETDRLAVRDLALFRLLYDTGCREAEAAAWRIDDLDVCEHSILVWDGKGGVSRKVYFGRRSSQALEVWLTMRPDCEWLFPSRMVARPAPLTPKGVYTALRRRCREARIEPPITPHMLRHSYATQAIRRGIDINHVQRQMGHASLSTTEIYIHPDDPARQAAHWAHAPGDVL